MHKLLRIVVAINYVLCALILYVCIYYCAYLQPFTDRMHDELMLGYCGAITFLDVQLGRILDVIDELHLWNNITIVLSADHGMHNGEKGIWLVEVFEFLFGLNIIMTM